MKLITSPFQCALRSPWSTMKSLEEGIVPICLHESKDRCFPCTDHNIFPKNCPLEDGRPGTLIKVMSRLHETEELIEIEPDKPFTNSKGIGYTRFNCVYWLNKNKQKEHSTNGPCISMYRVSPDCIGIHCGCFEPKVK